MSAEIDKVRSGYLTKSSAICATSRSTKTSAWFDQLASSGKEGKNDSMVIHQSSLPNKSRVYIFSIISSRTFAIRLQMMTSASFLNWLRSFTTRE